MKKVESYEKLFNEEEKKQIINDYTENYLSLRELREKYRINSCSWLRKIIGDKIRCFSDANKVVHKRHPEKYKLSESTKSKIREARLKFMKEHPEQTAWRMKNMSYPEKCFQKILEDNGLDKKYLIYREYSVFPYFIDFAFINEKLAVEIDGSQHLEEDRKKRDEKKDALLISNGWRVLRIAAIEVVRDGTKALSSLLEMLGNSASAYGKVGILKAPKTIASTHKVHSLKPVKVGIIKAPKLYEKAIRGEDGLTDKQRQNALNQRKVERPSKDELFALIKELPFTSIAKQYGVSDKAVVKWCERYDLPHRKKDIDDIIGKKHKYAFVKKICKRCGKEFNSRRDGNIFCSDECYKEYIKEHGNKEFHNTTKYNWIYKENSDGSFTNKRVSIDELEKYINDCWVIGRKI